jgi:UDP-glucose 4-epimerase
VDNRRFKAEGFTYRHDTAATVRHFAQARRVASVVEGTNPAYRYQADVEAFFRHSPAVIRPG